jgi:hypothetical protein
VSASTNIRINNGYNTNDTKYFVPETKPIEILARESEYILCTHSFVSFGGFVCTRNEVIFNGMVNDRLSYIIEVDIPQFTMFTDV